MSAEKKAPPLEAGAGPRHENLGVVIFSMPARSKKVNFSFPRSTVGMHTGILSIPYILSEKFFCLVPTASCLGVLSRRSF